MRICEICGRTSSACLFCRRVDPTQPKQFSHRFHSNLLAVISPTEFTEFTEPSCCDFLPQISQICTEASCREGSPTDFTDLHRCRRVWHPAVPTQPLTQPTICVDQCNPWENCIPTERRIHRIPNTHHLWESVTSVGVSSQQNTLKCNKNKLFLKKLVETFGGFAKKPYLCTRFKELSNTLKQPIQYIGRLAQLV